MTGMPFYVEKGPQFSVIESYVLDDPARGIALLQTLRAGGPPAAQALSVIAENIGLRSPALAAGPDTGDQRVNHLNRDWFEQRLDQQGTWQPDQHPQQPAVDQYGNWLWWQYYAGDVYEIMRTTMIRAGEVALGIASGEDPAHGRAAPWPIELFWHCSQNWFEGWVTWREHGGSGQVTVLLCTPSAGAPVRPSPLASGAPAADQQRAGANEYAEQPPTPGGHRGMVVVTHRYHRLVALGPTQLADARGPGMLTGPWRPYWQGNGPVVAVSPSEPDGGVLPGGRPFT